jgi:hypothetical protein
MHILCIIYIIVLHKYESFLSMLTIYDIIDIQISNWILVVLPNIISNTVKYNIVRYLYNAYLSINNNSNYNYLLLLKNYTYIYI